MKKRRAKAGIRDRQRSRVYKWEQNEAFPWAYQENAPRLTLEECQQLISRVWRDHTTSRRTSPRVTDGRGRRRPAALGDSLIKLPRWSRVPEIVLHEIAHTLLHNYARRHNTPIEVHGAEFVATFIDLISRYAGGDREALLASAERNGVRTAGFRLP